MQTKNASYKDNPRPRIKKTAPPDKEETVFIIPGCLLDPCIIIIRAINNLSATPYDP